MSRELLLKYANKSQQNNKRCFALRHWCDLQGNIFGFQEVFDCLYDFANGNMESITKAIEQLTTKSKVQGRSSVVWGNTGAKMYLTRDEDGKLTAKGHDKNFVPNRIGQHQTHEPNIMRNDGQVRRNVIASREKLFDLGKEVRSIYSDQSNAFLTGVMKAIKDYAKLHKKSENSVVDKLKRGVYRFDMSDGYDNARIVSDGRVVKMNESQLNGLSDATKLTEYKFYNNVQRFLSDLLKDPVGAKVPLLLQANNIARNYLLYHLKSNGIITRSQKISDKDSQGNPKTAKMVIKYSVPKKDFSKKMKKLFIDLVAKNVPEKIEKVMNECDGGVAMGGEPSGATSADASGQYSQPLFGIQRRKMPTDLEETTATTNVGNYEYTVPFDSDKETRDRHPGFSVERKDEDIDDIVESVIRRLAERL